MPEFSLKVGVPWIDRWQPRLRLVPDAIIVPHYNEFPEVMVNLMFGRRPQGIVFDWCRWTHGAGRRRSHVAGAWGQGESPCGAGEETKRYTTGQAVPLIS